MATLQESTSGEESVVEFPTQIQTIKYERPRVVRFSEICQISWIDHPSPDESNTKWFDEEDNLYFRRELRNDIMIVRMLAMDPSRGIAQVDIFKCVGIEPFLSRASAMRMLIKRREHIEAIIAEQTRQRDIGTTNVDQLSLVSKKSSRWAQERACELAGKYWSI